VIADKIGVFRYGGRAIRLVWQTSRSLAVALIALSVVGGVLPAAVAWVGKLIVDAVVDAMAAASASGQSFSDLAFGAGSPALQYVALEAVLVALVAANQRALAVIRSLLRALLGQRVNVMILEKAMALSLPHFEDSELYDRMTRARREASSRPLSVVMKTFGLAQDAIALVSFGGLLFAFSGLAVLVLALAAVPAFLAETRFSGEAFRLFKWRTPETRQQMYLETVLAREDFAKEVQLYGLGPRLLARYQAIFETLFAEDRKLTLRRGVWGYGLGLLSTAAFYGAYAWIALSAIGGGISLGEMTMYLLVFKQGQSTLASALSSLGGMYDDNLYLSNLYAFLDEDVAAPKGAATVGDKAGDGIRFESVSFTYPGAERPAVSGIDLHLRPGEKLALVGENGSGKTTLIKLMTRLYVPTEGRITLDGLDLGAWDPSALRARVGVIFQDFARYQMTVGENIGAGDVRAFDDATRWKSAAEKGLAAPFIDSLPEAYDTQLGRWFKGGRELSIGQWQKIALSRAFMRTEADILVLDEPTASMDAAAEMQIFERFRAMTEQQMAVLISHRFSTVRMADQIVVLGGGRILERGSHAQLVAQSGHYAHLFSLQAAGYQ
jgi:ABC-type multidrug transport system fused ATPase/permease subunit